MRRTGSVAMVARGPAGGLSAAARSGGAVTRPLTEHRRRAPRGKSRRPDQGRVEGRRPGRDRRP